jgi:hypothetical protein
MERYPVDKDRYCQQLGYTGGAYHDGVAWRCAGSQDPLDFNAVCKQLWGTGWMHNTWDCYPPAGSTPPAPTPDPTPTNPEPVYNPTPTPTPVTATPTPAPVTTTPNSGGTRPPNTTTPVSTPGGGTPTMPAAPKADDGQIIDGIPNLYLIGAVAALVLLKR